MLVISIAFLLILAASLCFAQPTQNIAANAGGMAAPVTTLISRAPLLAELDPSPGRQPMPTMCREQKSTSWMRDISHSTKRLTRSRCSSATSSNVWITKEDKGYSFRLPGDVRFAPIVEKVFFWLTGENF
jgi:hypothetical protein